MAVRGAYVELRSTPPSNTVPSPQLEAMCHELRVGTVWPRGVRGDIGLCSTEATGPRGVVGPRGAVGENGRPRIAAEAFPTCPAMPGDARRCPVRRPARAFLDDVKVQASPARGVAVQGPGRPDSPKPIVAIITGTNCWSG